MVEKKNLSTLVEAYARFAHASGERSKAETGNLNRSGAEIAEGKPELPETAGGNATATSAENCKLKTEHRPPGLVFVGSGELEGSLREQARALGLRVVDRTDWRLEKTGHGLTQIDADRSDRLAADRTKGNAASSVIAYGPSTASGPPVRAGCGLSPETTSGEDAAAMKARDLLPATRHEENCGTVFFYGFRQIEENPVFYALAEAFVLPSLKEEWGLVVNEAMAAGLPVIVSRTAGCAEDLLPGSESWQCSVGSVQSGENADADDCKLQTENSLERRSNGFVFDPRSSDALSEALRRIADCGTADGGDAAATLKAVMGKRSREIVAKFSCENFARQAMRAACAARGGGCESYW